MVGDLWGLFYCIRALGVVGISILFMSTLAWAHKVNVFAYSEGNTIFTESYFPDGRKVQGGKIEVYDSAGAKLLEGTNDEKGVFNFKPPKKDDLKIVSRY
jgi:nickel transport protein